MNLSMNRPGLPLFCSLTYMPHVLEKDIALRVHPLIAQCLFKMVILSVLLVEQSSLSRDLLSGQPRKPCAQVE